MNGYASVAKNLVDCLAGWNVTFKSYKALPVQRRDVNPLLSCKFMLRTANEYQGVVTKRNDFDLWLGSRLRDDPNVDHVIEYVFIDLIWTAVFDVDINVRVRLDETLKHR